MTKQLTLDELQINHQEFQLLTDIVTVHAYKNFPLNFLLTRYLGWDDDTVENFISLSETEKSKDVKSQPNPCACEPSDPCKYGCDTIE
jgi:hypothetical protein